MTWELLEVVIVLVLMVLVFAGFVRERLGPDVVAMLALGALVATGILNSNEALSVFSNSGPITVACMFVLSAALERTGVVERMGGVAITAASRSPRLALVGMSVAVISISAFINNTPVVVVLTPVTILMARTLQVAPSKLLIPLSFTSIFGGTTTLIGTSTTLLVNGVAVSHGLPAISMFEITAPGIVLGLLGITYLVVFGRWLLPDRRSPVVEQPERLFLSEVLIPSDSPLVGRTLAQAGLRGSEAVRVLDVIKRDRSFRYALDDVVLEAGSRVVLETHAGGLLGLHETGSLIFGARDQHLIEPIREEPGVLMEGVVGPYSRMIGHPIADLNLRLYGVYILAVHRQGTELHGNFDELTLASGDILLLEGTTEGLRRLFDRRELVNLTEPSDRPLRPDKAYIAVGAVAAVTVLGAFEILPIEMLALIGATAVVALGCLRPDEAYEAIQWRILLLIFGMLGLGTAFEKTGAADLLVQQVMNLASGLSPVVILALLYLFASILTEVMSNNATALLITPIAIALAEQLGLDPRPFLMAVVFAASASFATPIRMDEVARFV
ncbi:SLC13 family permease [Microvirga massiliensis]|uniref:SLC13 family permease n=1 Tax=Microvirga massiliensis TaxID=1033741 RepID=UPI00069BFB4E|nr:SLC13 family permease [Microvirga massiliensis]